MIDDVNIKRRQMNKAYRDLFGYIPLPSDYACTSKEFFESVEKAVTDSLEDFCRYLNAGGISQDSYDRIFRN